MPSSAIEAWALDLPPSVRWHCEDIARDTGVAITDVLRVVRVLRDEGVDWSEARRV